ncbi:ATP-binding protein [Selenomonas sp.]|uniref:ATP-binding protein n=1 Tax=Selenomonas sp. TaxID=2053611 RepID=UPI0025DD49D6|nr:ATP-binding protein [Selenomonas sp.]MBQ1867485.1 putative DNA binding domain-containing protein [Selenomonas sp.]
MQAEELVALVEEIRQQRSERQNIELKEAGKGFPHRIYDTLSSFSNQDMGGVIIFGVGDKPTYNVVGVYDLEDAQKKIMEACNQMEPKVRPLLTVGVVDGKVLLAAEIPGVEYALRPVFYTGAGRLSGSFIRIGDADERMTEYEIYSFEAFRRNMHEELRPVERSVMKLLNQQRMDAYVERVRQERPNLFRNVETTQLLELMGVCENGAYTLAGALVFSQYPQAYYPQLCITAVSLPGVQMGELGDEEERFIDNQRIVGAIPDMIDDAVNFVRRNSRVRTIITEDGRRRDRYEYPLKAVREAIINALIHRDYSRYTEGVPVRIEMYRDRLEIRSSGVPYGGISTKSLGHVRPETRNAALANMLEILQITENRYSGIPTIQRELAEAHMPPAEFAVNHEDFIVRFRNNIYNQPLAVKEAVGAAYGGSRRKKSPEKIKAEEQLLAFCQQPRSSQEIADLYGTSRENIMARFVTPMLHKGILLRTMPDKPRSPRQRYVSAKIVP